jgi:hypothetical protein
VCALGARAMTKPLVCARQCPLQFPLHPYNRRENASGTQETEGLCPRVTSRT